jgi:hypothetical protein
MTSLDQARTSLLDVVAFLDALPATNAEAPAPKADPSVATQAFALAVLKDEPLPISLLAPWASYVRFRQWELAGKIKLERANGKVCVQPSVFFAFWRSLPKDEPRKCHPRRKKAVSVR